MKKMTLFVFSLVLMAPVLGQLDSEIAKEKEAIKAVILQETQSYFDRDYEGYAATYKHDESLVDLRAYSTNYSQAQGWENRSTWMKSFVQNNPEPAKNTEVKENFRIQVYPASAWAIFDNLLYDEEGKLQALDVGVNFLEKVDGKWKIVYLSRVGVSSYSGDFEQIDVPDAILSRYLGKYELQPGFILEFKLEDGHFYVYPTGQQRQELFAYEENKFFLMTINAQIEFNMEDGKAVSLTLHQNGEFQAMRTE